MPATLLGRGDRLRPGSRRGIDANDIREVGCVPTKYFAVVRRRTGAQPRAAALARLRRIILRGLAYAPYADLIWCETSKPDLAEAKRFAEGAHKQFPGKLLAYNCSPSFNWKRRLDDDEIAAFQQRLAEAGYRFQFVTLAGFHALNASMFELARGYAEEGMPAYVRLQQHEFELEDQGYTATRHQHEVGAGYFDLVA